MHFNIIEKQVCNTMIRLRQELCLAKPSHCFAFPCLDNVKYIRTYMGRAYYCQLIKYCFPLNDLKFYDELRIKLSTPLSIEISSTKRVDSLSALYV